MIEELLKREREEVRLQKLPPEIYSNVLHYMREIKNKIKTKEGLEKRVLEKELETVRKQFSELIETRIEKVVAVEDQHLTSEEEKIFKEISELIKKYKKAVVTKTIPRTVTVRLKKDLPEIVGPDLNVYGPFKEGEDVELPIEVGILLMKSKIGVKGEKE